MNEPYTVNIVHMHNNLLKDARQRIILVKLANRVAQLRRERGLSQETLAIACGKSVNFIKRIESGQYNPGLIALGILAEALEISLDELLNFKPRGTSHDN